MADIIDLKLHKSTKPLFNQVDPCSSCPEVSFCRDSCALAKAWWDQFSKKFNIQTGGEI
jgi:hypothetical protein